MIEFLVGSVAGAVVGVFAKDKVMGPDSQKMSLQRDVESLSEENEKLRRRHKEAERQVEDLLVQLERMKRSAKDDEDAQDDLEDDLLAAQRKIKSLTALNEELERKCQEYKETCIAQEAEIAQLKGTV